jgi:hypothetical protein
MAETAQTLINDILQEIYVQADEQSIQSVDFEAALRYTNRYMDQLSADGLDLTWTTLEDPADPVTSPDGAIMGIIKNAALYLANTYDIEVSQRLVSDADDSMRTLEKIGMTLPQSNFPSTLPIGTGNNATHYTDNYYVGYNEDIDTTEA